MSAIVCATIALIFIILILGYFSRTKKDKKDVDRKVNVDENYINQYISRFNKRNSDKKK